MAIDRRGLHPYDPIVIASRVVACIDEPWNDSPPVQGRTS